MAHEGEEAEGAAMVSACEARCCQGSPSGAAAFSERDSGLTPESDAQQFTDWGQHRRRPSVCDVSQAEQGLAVRPGLSGSGQGGPNGDPSHASDVARDFLSDWAFLSVVAAVASFLVVLLLLVYLKDDAGLNDLVPKLAMRMLEREGLLYACTLCV